MNKMVRHWPVEGLQWGVGCRGDLQVARWRPKGLPYISEGWTCICRFILLMTVRPPLHSAVGVGPLGWSFSMPRSVGVDHQQASGEPSKKSERS